MDREPRAKFDERISQQFRALDLPTGTVLDAEYVGPRGGHAPTAYIFDMLAWDGTWIADLPYEERWRRCCNLILPTCGIIHLAHTVVSDFIGLFDRLKAAWVADGCGMSLTEGIVVKRRDGTAALDHDKRRKARWLHKCKFRDITSRRF